jgi:hypothetical protein
MSLVVLCLLKNIVSGAGVSSGLQKLFRVGPLVQASECFSIVSAPPSLSSAETPCGRRRRSPWITAHQPLLRKVCIGDFAKCFFVLIVPHRRGQVLRCQAFLEQREAREGVERPLNSQLSVVDLPVNA